MLQRKKLGSGGETGLGKNCARVGRTGSPTRQRLNVRPSTPTLAFYPRDMKIYAYTQEHIFPEAVLSMAKTEKNPDVHQQMNE